MIERGTRQFGFPRSARLLRSFEYQHVIQHGKRLRSRYLTIWSANNQDRGTRLGLIISRKAGKAHYRNQVKRALRDEFRLRLRPTQQNLDIVIRINPQPERVPARTLRAMFREIADQQGLT